LLLCRFCAAAAAAVHNNTQLEHCLPSMPLSLWETPSLTNQNATSAYDSTLFAFSALLVVTSDTLKSHDVQVIQAALANNKPVAVVRSKADVSVTNLRRQLRL